MISIILVEPESAHNIGAVARAMKNMGLFDLRCVKPPKDWRKKGRTLAVSADDVLKNAKSFKTAARAVEDSYWVIGTTRRKGSQRGTFMEFNRAISLMKQKSQKGPVAILFGAESRGLDNASLELCDAVVTIPSHESYPSLNLAQAVMVVAFSLFIKNVSKKEKERASAPRFCRKREVQETLRHFERALDALNYPRGNGNLLGRILSVFHGIFKRGGMLEIEARMIKGLSARISHKGISCKS